MPNFPKTGRRLFVFITGITLSLGLLLPVGAAATDSDPRVILAEIQQLLEQGDFTTARTRLAQALRKFPNEAALYNFMGVVEAHAGNYRAAELDFQDAVEKAPRFTGAYLNLAHLYQEHPDKIPQALKKALETYQRLLKFEPDNLEANYQLALLLQIQGSFQSSLEHLRRLPVDAQHGPRALAVRCADYAALEERGQADSAAQELAQRADLLESDVTSILPVLEKHDRPDLEIMLLAALTERKLASSFALYKLGVVYEHQGEYQQAREVLEKISQQGPNAVPLLIELARIADKQGDNKGALGYLAHARDLEPANAATHFFFGMVCVKENLAEEAYRSLKKAVMLDPNNAYYNYAFAAVAVELKEYASESIPYFKKYIELRPQDPRGRLALGAGYFYNYEDEQARKVLEEVADIPQTAAAAHYFLGRVATHQGRFADAIKELEQALAAQPRFADAHAEMGLVFLKQNLYAQAEKSLRQALDQDPDSYTANLNLMILYQRTEDPRAEEQSKRFEKIRQERAGRAQEFLRTIVVKP